MTSQASIDSETPPNALLQLLIAAGERLPKATREQLLARGPALIAELLQLLQDPSLEEEGAPGDGYVPIHAAQLLGDLKAEAAIGPLFKIVSELEFDAMIHSVATAALIKIGPAALEPVLHACENAEEQALRAFLEIACNLGVQDPRTTRHLQHLFETAPELAACYAASYGDPSFLPKLAALIADLKGSLGNRVARFRLVECEAAYEAIHGSLPEHLLSQIAEIRASWELQGPLDAEDEDEDEGHECDDPDCDGHDHDDAEHESEHEPVHAAPEAPVSPALVSEKPVVSQKIGRNEPCPCGSGKKFKRCCGNPSLSPGP